MRIAIDIDSTLFHYWDGFARAAKQRFGVHIPYQEQSVWEISQLRPEQVHCVVQETHRDENILKGEPYPGAVETVAAWKADGHYIHITSHRADACHDATAEWLERIGLPYDDLYCSFDKVTRCVELEIDVLIDDSPVNLRRAIDEGISVATIVHPWNRDLCEDETIVCAEDWAGLRAGLAGLLAGEPAGVPPRAGG